MSKELVKKYFTENWIYAKKNLSEWEDLNEINNKTENFDLSIETTKNLKLINEKMKLLDGDSTPENQSFGIVEMMTSMIEKIDLFDNIEDLKDTKQKELLFVYNLCF